tara:strand:+ start:25241 stop:25816 length:576 start_codon:yes stop_codon:yes gene_type:complete
MTTPSSSAPVLPTPALEELESLNATALKARLHRRVEDAFQLCREVHPALPRPTVWLDLRGKSAGQAHFGRGGLRFNAQLYAENRQAFLVEVVPHEMAHWLVWHLDEGPRLRPHGHEWKTVMRQLFGLAPITTHRFDVTRASPAPYRYACGCQEHFFSLRRHRRATQGQAYRCRQCGETLVYQSAQASEKTQ